MSKNRQAEWTASVRKDGGAVRVYRWGKLQREISPCSKKGEETYEPAGAIKFAEQLVGELYKQSSALRKKKADHDVQTEPNLENTAKGTQVKGKPSPTLSNAIDKVAQLEEENRKMKAQLAEQGRKHKLETKARRGAKLAELLVKAGAIAEDEKEIKAFVTDIAMMTDEEIDRLERKAAGESEFTSVEEAERAKRGYDRQARQLQRKADEAQDAGDAEAADKFDASAEDAMKNADCCKAFIRSAAHEVTAQEKGKCEKCGKPNFLCTCKEGAAEGKEKDAATDTEGEEKDAATDAEGEEKDGEVEKTADHDVQTEPNLKNDAKGVAVTGKPSPSTNTKAGDEGVKKEAVEKEAECDCDGDPCESKDKQASADDAEGATETEEKSVTAQLTEQHSAMAGMYRKMATEAEERGDVVAADIYDHKADVCEHLAKDADLEVSSPEPELGGTVEDREASADDSTDHEASEEASEEDTDGPSESSTKVASAIDEDEISQELIDAALTPPEVYALRSVSRGQRRSEPSRVDPEASGVTRIASVEENAASYDKDVAELESLWTGAPRDEE